MSTIQTTLKRTPSRWTSAVVATAGALIAVALALLFLGLAAGSRGHHAATSNPAPTYYPLIHYRDVVVPRAAAERTPTTTRTPLNPRRSYGAVP
jgi:hypothetical protein